MNKAHKFVTRPEILKWLKTLPKNKEFEYLDNHNCLLAQFLQSKRVVANVGGATYTTDFGYYDIPQIVRNLIYDAFDLDNKQGKCSVERAIRVFAKKKKKINKK